MADIPQEVWDDLRYEIARNGLENADNFRAYRMRGHLGYEAYLNARNTGCCGFFESSTMVDGEKWIIGCNYGH